MVHMLFCRKEIILFLSIVFLAGCATVRRTSQGTVPPAPVWEKKTAPVTIEDSPGYLRYIVQRGDSLWKISQMAYNDSGKWSKIFDANRDKIKDVKSLKPGEILIIPRE